MIAPRVRRFCFASFSPLALAGTFLFSLAVEAAPKVEADRAQIEIVGSDAQVRKLPTNRAPGRIGFLYRDRDYRVIEGFPAFLEGGYFYEANFNEAHVFRCVRGGALWVVAPVNANGEPAAEVRAADFQAVPDTKPFQFWGPKPEALCAVFTKQVKTSDEIHLPAGAIAIGFDPVRSMPTGELLYNGIRLPREWPPKVDFKSDEPPTAPYLVAPPKLIYIDVGRQLLVDDFLIESTDLEREFHYPQKYEGNPVLKPETQIEKSGPNNLAGAGPKSGGLWWNPEMKLFELWYEASWLGTIAYATSRDGLHWDRPSLPLNPGTNQVLPPDVKPDSWTVVRDYRSVDPRQNYKIFLRGGETHDRARYFTSPDGLDWGTVRDGGISGDRSTVFYNSFRKKWIYGLRRSSPGGRARSYWESDDFERGMRWLPDEPVPWVRTDRLDPVDPRVGDSPQLYNMDAVPYESILLGFFEIFHGPDNVKSAAAGIPKFTGLNFAYSRDGFHWHRPDRKMAIDSEMRPTWDRGYVQSLGDICTVRGDKLWFYYIGFAGDENAKLGSPGVGKAIRSGAYANSATGVAFLRRDGFVSLNAGSKPLFLATRPVVFSGRCLFVNADVPQGALAAEVQDLAGKPIEPFTFANCRSVRADSTLTQIQWTGGSDLTKLANRPVRFRFKLENGKFYSFWVSRDETGRSDGYVAGGGPGFTSDIDTVGRAALEAESTTYRAGRIAP